MKKTLKQIIRKIEKVYLQITIYMKKLKKDYSKNNLNKIYSKTHKIIKKVYSINNESNYKFFFFMPF